MHTHKPERESARIPQQTGKRETIQKRDFKKSIIDGMVR
jgi:hypothetical protein